MVGIDHDEVVLQAIKDGFVNGTMLQNPYGQGYIGSYALDKLRTGCTVKADAPLEVERADRQVRRQRHGLRRCRRQVDTYVDAMRGITKDLLATFEDDYLTARKRRLAAEAPSRRLRPSDDALRGVQRADEPRPSPTSATADDRRAPDAAARPRGGFLLSNEFGLVVLIALPSRCSSPRCARLHLALQPLHHRPHRSASTS